MKRSEYESGFLSEDLYLCSFLLASGHSLLGYTKNDRKVTLCFLRTPAIEEDTLAYYNSGKITASRLFDCYRRLKDLIFQAARNENEKNVGRTI